MASKAEKERRKLLTQKLADIEYDTFIKSLPIKEELIHKLFDYLDAEFEERECENNYIITDDFLKHKKIENIKLKKWFQENGGYCDCEILNNIEEKFKD